MWTVWKNRGFTLCPQAFGHGSKRYCINIWDNTALFWGASLSPSFQPNNNCCYRNNSYYRFDGYTLFQATVDTESNHLGNSTCTKNYIWKMEIRKTKRSSNRNHSCL